MKISGLVIAVIAMMNLLRAGSMVDQLPGPAISGHLAWLAKPL